MVLALNMMDIVAKRGMDIDLHRLSEDPWNPRYSGNSS